MRAEGVCAARRVARAVLRRFGIERPEDIRIDAIARAFGIEIELAPLSNMTAQLIRGPSRCVIRVSDTETDEGALRFSIAHELGHFLLEHTTPLGEIHEPRYRVADGERDIEEEANVFAAELLMPRELVSVHLNVPRVSLDPSHAIAKRFNVSILTATRRFAELSSARCAAVFSMDGRVTWVEKSNTFATYIKRGQQLAPRSIAAEYFAGFGIAEGPRRVPAEAWPDVVAGSEIVEHAIASAKHRTVLSIVWIPESGSADPVQKRR